jgi:hypothetical protein
MSFRGPLRFEHEGHRFVVEEDFGAIRSGEWPTRAGDGMWRVHVDEVDHGCVFPMTQADSADRVQKKAIRWWQRRQAEDPRR